MDLRNYIPSISGANMTFSPLSKEHRQRQKEMGMLWNYYRGNHKKQLKRKTGQADDNVILNFSKPIVDMSVSFLFGAGIEFDLGDNAETQKKYLDNLFGDDLNLLLEEIGINGSYSGTSFVKVKAPTEEGGQPEMVTQNSEYMDFVTDPDDKNKILEYHIVWFSADIWKRQRIVKNDEGLFWTIIDEHHMREKWIEVNRGPWEYEFPPIFFCQNLTNPGGNWGISDLDEAELNDSVNFVRSNMQRIIRLHAHPSTIVTGASTSAVSQETGPGKMWKFAEPETRAYNLEMGSDLVSSQNHANDMTESFHTVSGTPRLDPAQVNVGALSGFALTILYGPLLSKTKRKQNTYGKMLKSVVRALLILGGQEPPDKIKIKWGNPLPVNKNEQYTQIEQLTRSGASIEAAAFEVWGDEERANRLAAVDMGVLER